MLYYKKITSSLGDITLRSDGEYLTGLWFAGDKHYSDKDIAGGEVKNLPVFEVTGHWLTEYFAGKKPEIVVPLKLAGSDFQMQVWELLKEIPYGNLITYGDIAKLLAAKNGIARMSAQAVGGAVGHNPICIIVPCHRVIGASGSLTGYGGGMWRKVQLLELEGVEMGKLTIPTKGTAL